MEFIEIQWNSELYALEIELRDRLLRAPLGMGFSTQELAAESSELHFGLIQEGKVKACAVIVPSTPDQAKLRQMAVHEDHQRQGLGSTLVRQIESELRRRDFQRVELHAREQAVPFYERLGYRTIGERFIEVNIAHWKMYHQLTETDGIVG